MIALALDVILVLVVAEALGLVALHARTGRGIKPRHILANLAAGFCLMLALRLSLEGGRQDASAQAMIALVLLAALLAHVLDLASRWGTQT